MSKSSSFPNKDTIELLVTIKQLNITICYLILGCFAEFDLLMMDVGCQDKVLGLIEAYENLHILLTDISKEWGWAKSIFQEWID